MTIHNCTWSAFWETVYYLHWSEIFALLCFGAGWVFSIKKMRETQETTGKSSKFLLLTILGCVFAIWYKLFVQLDVVVLWYIYLLVIVFTEFYQYSVLARRASEQSVIKARKEVIERRMSALKDLDKKNPDKDGSDKKDVRHHHHRHHHHHSASCVGESAKDPKFDGAIVFDDADFSNESVKTETVGN